MNDCELVLKLFQLSTGDLYFRSKDVDTPEYIIMEDQHPPALKRGHSYWD